MATATATAERVETTMKRSEIIDEAKRMVLAHGPSNVLEFGDEYVRDTRSVLGWTREETDAVLAEAVKQALRVYAFLGYERRY